MRNLVLGSINPLEYQEAVILIRVKGAGVKGQSTHGFLEEEDGQSADQRHVPQQRLHHHSQRPVKLDTEDKTSQTLSDDAMMLLPVLRLV